jgi:acyl-CoA synthetase (AMP-forming)/AMP-acid ligase II
VAVIAPNVPALAVGLFAVWRAGAVAVPLSTRLRRFELQRAFADARPAAVVTVAQHAGFEVGLEVRALAAQTPSVRTCMLVDDRGEERDLVSSPGAEPAPGLAAGLAAIMYTSGTTGEPKGALVPHALAEATAVNLVELLGADAGAPYGLIVPASHVFGLGCLLCGVVGGANAVLVDATASLEPLVRSLHEHGARVLHGTPALWARALRSRAQLPIRCGFTAGSSCPPEVLSALEQRGVRLLNVYGMSEIGAASACRAEDPPALRHKTVGRALAGYELRIASPAGPETPGEIQVRSAYLPSGYHGLAWGPDELTDDGWFRTGDLGRLDVGGNLEIVGRAKEVVHVGGFNVFPAEVESFLLTHPAIAQAAVLGVPSRALGEALEAFVVAEAGAVIEPSEVIRFAREGIAGYKVPYTVTVLDELPLLSSGKPDRRALGEAAAAGSARSHAGVDRAEPRRAPAETER